jgi:hypothetical protein
MIGPCGMTKGQDILQDTIRWTASGFNDLRTSRDINAGCQFITFKKEKIEWIQSNGKVVYEMPIRKISGDWENINKDGVINYAFELDRVAGRMIIQRIKGEVRLMLVFSDWSGGPIENRYNISKVEILKE